MTEPGWYRDPWNPAGWRWHDGTEWTSWTGPPPGPPPPPAPTPAPTATPTLTQTPASAGPSTDADLGTERRVRPWGLLALVALPLVQVLSAALIAAVVDGLFEHAFDVASDPNATQQELEAALDDAVDDLQDLGAGATLVNLVGLVPIALAIAAAVWANRVAAVARRLGYPARRSTAWAAAGWFVPVVNLWFPYQAVVDALRPGHPARNVVLGWWLLLVGAFVASIPVAAVGMFSGFDAVATPLAIAATVAAAAAFAGARVVQLVHHDHADALVSSPR